jgi:hypothetical protein
MYGIKHSNQIQFINNIIIFLKNKKRYCDFNYKKKNLVNPTYQLILQVRSPVDHFTSKSPANLAAVILGISITIGASGGNKILVSHEINEK